MTTNEPKATHNNSYEIVVLLIILVITYYLLKVGLLCFNITIKKMCIQMKGVSHYIKPSVYATLAE